MKFYFRVNIIMKILESQVTFGYVLFKKLNNELVI